MKIGSEDGYRITFVLGRDEELLQKSINTLLATLTFCDVAYLRNHPEVPPIYQSGVRYQRECGSNDDWQDVPTTLKLKTGDCEDFACWRAAELQARGIAAWPMTLVRRTPSGKIAFHPVVKWPDGRIEDPARRLGLDGEEMAEHSCTGLGGGIEENRIRFCINLFEGTKELPLSHRTLMYMLHALCLIDMRYLLKYPNTPLLYDTGVHYEYEPEGREDWQDVPTNMRRGEADCEDLASHRAAELRVRGVKAWPRFTSRIRSNGSFLYHIIVCYKNPELGRYISDPDDPDYDPRYIEDPSKKLGMR
jgi:hypothetical protein